MQPLELHRRRWCAFERYALDTHGVELRRRQTSYRAVVRDLERRLTEVVVEFVPPPGTRTGEPTESDEKHG